MPTNLEKIEQLFGPGFPSHFHPFRNPPENQNMETISDAQVEKGIKIATQAASPQEWEAFWKTFRGFYLQQVHSATDEDLKDIRAICRATNHIESVFKSFREGSEKVPSNT